MNQEKIQINQELKEIEHVIYLIALKRRHGDSSMEVYIKYPGTLSHLQSIGYDVNEIDRDCLTKIIVTW